MGIFVERTKGLLSCANGRVRFAGQSALMALMLCCVTVASAQIAGGPAQPPVLESGNPALPDAPSTTAPPSENFLGSLGTAAKTIGEDEWHFIKAPFHKKALIWDGLFLASTGVLIANDESVMYQVPVSWHSTSRNISNGALYGTSAIAGGIYLTGLFTKDEHEQEVGIRTAEATVDSVIMYGALKAIFQRQRPYSGPGEGKFFAGNWTNGSFPSGHAMFTWTIASAVAHQYHSIPLDLALYGLASTVTVTRVTAGQHFPSDVFVGSILGYLIGDYVAHKQQEVGPIRAGKLERVRNALLEHVDIGVE
jgi:PAP2 superfamily